MPKVYNRHHKNAPADAVYVGRGSPWGNPFVIGEDGTRDEVCEKYERMIEEQGDLAKRIIRGRLRGKDLVCYCSPQRCHGDYLLRIANEEES